MAESNEGTSRRESAICPSAVEDSGGGRKERMHASALKGSVEIPTYADVTQCDAAEAIEWRPIAEHILAFQLKRTPVSARCMRATLFVAAQLRPRRCPSIKQAHVLSGSQRARLKWTAASPKRGSRRRSWCTLALCGRGCLGRAKRS